MNTRYRIEEGSVELPQGFEDRSTNIFVPGKTHPPPLNLNIARDTLLTAETLPAYVNRQIELLQKNLRGHAVVKRETATLGSSDHELVGEQITATHRSGNTLMHQRQAAFVCAPGRVLIFSCTSVRPFDDGQDALWRNWLGSFQPAMDH